jgi:hypothetical protein
VHESPVRGQRTRPTLKAGTPSLECITENSCEELHIDSKRNSTVVAVRFDVCHSDQGKTYCGFNVC